MLFRSLNNTLSSVGFKEACCLVSEFRKSINNRLLRVILELLILKKSFTQRLIPSVLYKKAVVNQGKIALIITDQST